MKKGPAAGSPLPQGKRASVEHLMHTIVPTNVGGNSWPLRRAYYTGHILHICQPDPHSSKSTPSSYFPAILALEDATLPLTGCIPKPLTTHLAK